MAVPSLIADKLVFAFDDPDRHFARVALDCDDAITGRRRFRRTSLGWGLAIPRPELRRVEYRLLLTSRDGSVQVVCDPANPERVRTAFGERSVALLPGYERPAWLDSGAPEGRYQTFSHEDAVIGDLPISVWSPLGLADEIPARLLIVHDGPEYAELSSLTVYASAMAASGALPPFRLALMQPVHRDEWYAANPDYVRAELDSIDTIRQRFAITPHLAVMGASLGGLSALALGLEGQPRVRGVFSQSGSFFEEKLDSQESAYPHFTRIVAAVRQIAATGRTEQPLHVALTCGIREENYANNVAMAKALTRLGHHVDLVDVPDLHNYTAWRDSLHPALTDMLRSVWCAQG
jgi:enterochelin esterase family protein